MTGLLAVDPTAMDGGGGNSWYWFEGDRDDVVANGQGDVTCTGCHGRAPRDFVHTIVAE